MLQFNNRKTYRRFIYSPLSLLLLFIVLVILLKALWGVYGKERTSYRYLSQEQGELDKLSARQKDLAQSVEYIKTDKGMEAEIRSKFRVVKEGERVAVIVDGDSPSKAAHQAVSTSTMPSNSLDSFFSAWKSWWHGFGW